MSNIREKITKIKPKLQWLDYRDGFFDALSAAADIAEAEVARLEADIATKDYFINKQKFVIPDGVSFPDFLDMPDEWVPKQVYDGVVEEKKRLEARVRELEDFARFMCATWVEIDSFVRENCTGDEIMKYPVIQGTSNQIALMLIARQKYDKMNIAKAVERVIGG